MKIQDHSLEEGIILKTSIEVPHFFTTKRLDIAHNYHRPISDQKEDMDKILSVSGVDKLFLLNQAPNNDILYVDENLTEEKAIAILTEDCTSVLQNKAIDASHTALVTDKQNIAIGVLSADCVPMLFYDQENKVIGAAHVGWRGAKQNICHNVIAKMQKLGTKIENIGVIIGPYIHQKSYEVDLNYKNIFLSDDQNNEQFFIPSIKDNHFMFDLGGYVKYKLKASGIQNISDINMDTYSNPDLFFSYRRDCHNGLSYQMRNILSVISL